VVGSCEHGNKALGSTKGKQFDYLSILLAFQEELCSMNFVTAGRSGFDPRQGQRIFPLSSVSRPALGPTQPPVQWVPGVHSLGVKRSRGVMLTTHPHLVPRS
jgi:hypothetical protein